MLFGAAWPSALDSDTLRVVVVVIILAIVGISIALSLFITRMVTKMVVLGIGAVLVITLWNARADLGDCAQTCSCSLFGQDVTVAACEDQLPGGVELPGRN
ncbi:MAG: hypothetical protein KAZ88_07735 [Acidimicrobiia bacterium]|nr:hypothetical protein [Acidimicrobiia bacterium]MBP8180868.1 hypothetical protein [Acidimicrobiia bacterium]